MIHPRVGLRRHDGLGAVGDAQADAKLDKMDLTSLLYFQGYGGDRFVTG